MKKQILIPKGAKPTNECALAYGEATGHSHSLQGVVGEDFQIYEVDGVKFCELKKPEVKLKHEEHNPIVLKQCNFPQGMVVDIVSEYDHFAEEARPVID